MRFFLDSLKISATSLLARKIRSSLSVLGIVIGILTVSGLLTLGLGVKKEITKSIQNLGANLLAVLPGKVEDGGNANFAAQLGASTLTEADYEAIKTQAPEAQNLSIAMLVAGTVKSEKGQLPAAFIFAASPGIEKTLNMEIDRGRFPDIRDEISRIRVVVLGAKAAETLFPDAEALEQTVDIRGEAFQVTGVLKEVDAGLNFGGPDMNSVVLMPIRSGWEVTKTEQIFRIMMQAPDAAGVEALKEKVKGVILRNHGGEEDFSVFTQDDILGLVGKILNILTAMLSAIAGISLVVGGIGIMNIMLVSVHERTREIGVRKAVGATHGAILLQFLIEAVILTLAAGLVSVSIYTAAIKIAGPRSPIPLEINPIILLLSLGFAAVVGIIFGILPALTAARKDPIEALRYE